MVNEGEDNLVPVLMTETRDGSPDSAYKRTYYQGRCYDLPVELADVFVDQLKCAVRVEEAVEFETPKAKQKSTKRK